MNNYKPKPIKYNSGESIIKIRIEEPSGALMENWTVMASDLWKWARAMRLKYGLNFDEKKKTVNDRDLDWMR